MAERFKADENEIEGMESQSPIKRQLDQLSEPVLLFILNILRARRRRNRRNTSDTARLV